MIYDGVELPRLLPLAKAAEILEIPVGEVEALLQQHELRSVSLNGIPHVLTDSIADRLGEPTPSRHNRDCDEAIPNDHGKARWL